MENKDNITAMPLSPDILRELRESVAGSDCIAPRRYSAAEATGIAPLKNPSLSLEEEKEALIEALLEKYERAAKVLNDLIDK
jgi:hypothetical protein